jgi:RimJ/RimL family protein N-acetyltransferase
MPLLAPVTLEGHHVRLEPVAHVHLDDLARVSAEPATFRYFASPDLGDRDELRRALERAARELSIGSALTFAQIDLARNEAVGMTALFDLSEQDQRLEIGRTWLAEAARRTPINTEAKLLLLTHAFESLGMRRVQIKTDARNLASQRAIERLGAVKEGTWRQHMKMRDGFQRDTVMYSIVAPEWPGVKERLSARLCNTAG